MLQAHGDMDPTVPCLWGQMTAQLLSNFLTKHEFKLYKVQPGDKQLEYQTNVIYVHCSFSRV